MRGFRARPLPRPRPQPDQPRSRHRCRNPRQSDRPGHQTRRQHLLCSYSPFRCNLSTEPQDTRSEEGSATRFASFSESTFRQRRRQVLAGARLEAARITPANSFVEAVLNHRARKLIVSGNVVQDVQDGIAYVCHPGRAGGTPPYARETRVNARIRHRDISGPPRTRSKVKVGRHVEERDRVRCNRLKGPPMRQVLDQSSLTGLKSAQIESFPRSDRASTWVQRHSPRTPPGRPRRGPTVTLSSSPSFRAFSELGSEDSCDGKHSHPR